MCTSLALANNPCKTDVPGAGHRGSHPGRYHIVNYVRYRPASRGVATAVNSNVIELSSGTARLLNFPSHLSLVCCKPLHEGPSRSRFNYRAPLAPSHLISYREETHKLRVLRPSTGELLQCSILDDIYKLMAVQHLIYVISSNMTS